MTDYHFFVTVKKRDDLDEPTNIERAEAMIRWLLLNGSYLDVVKIERVEKEYRV